MRPVSRWRGRLESIARVVTRGVSLAMDGVAIAPWKVPRSSQMIIVIICN